MSDTAEERAYRLAGILQQSLAWFTGWALILPPFLWTAWGGSGFFLGVIILLSGLVGILLASRRKRYWAAMLTDEQIKRQQAAGA